VNQRNSSAKGAKKGPATGGPTSPRGRPLQKKTSNFSKLGRGMFLRKGPAQQKGGVVGKAVEKRTRPNRGSMEVRCSPLKRGCQGRRKWGGKRKKRGASYFLLKSCQKSSKEVRGGILRKVTSDAVDTRDLKRGSPGPKGREQAPPCPKGGGVDKRDKRGKKKAGFLGSKEPVSY